MANLRDIVVDCAHPASLARFWAAVLDDYEVAPYDEAELARLRANGIDDTEDDPSVLVQPVGATAYPRIFFQLVPEPKAGKNRLHLDVVPTDRTRDEEVERLTGLGATEYEDHRDLDGTGWVTMADPEGNVFCVSRGATEQSAVWQSPSP
jgi:hypothetical protein